MHKLATGSFLIFLLNGCTYNNYKVINKTKVNQYGQVEFASLPASDYLQLLPFLDRQLKGKDLKSSDSLHHSYQFQIDPSGKLKFQKTIPNCHYFVEKYIEIGGAFSVNIITEGNNKVNIYSFSKNGKQTLFKRKTFLSLLNYEYVISE